MVSDRRLTFFSTSSFGKTIEGMVMHFIKGIVGGQHLTLEDSYEALRGG
jgi:hypothetical protein